MRQLSSLCLLAGILIPVAWQGAARAEPKYTQHPPHAGRTETIVVYLDPRFADGDRGDIVSAIDEWNRALNGVMKFEAVPLPPAAERNRRAWVIMRGAGKEGVSEVGRTERSVGTLQPMPMGGGVLLVLDGALKPSADRPLTLRDVMMRELGHLAGLRHTTQTELLSGQYLLGDKSCVTRATAAAIATLRDVPVESLNWCTTN